MNEIDPARNYTAKEVAAMFGVSVGTVYRRLTSSPTPFGKRLYSGVSILTAITANGFTIRERPAGEFARQMAELEQSR